MNYVDVFNHLQPVAQIARGCPTPTLRQAYVDAMRQWCSETQWLRIAIAGATTADTAQYSLGSDTYVEILAVAAMSGTHDSQQWPLVKGDPSGWNANAGTDRPRFYTYVPEGQFALFPTPDDTYNLTVTASIDGTLQEMPLELGQQVALGANVGKISRHDSLMARLRIQETQIRDVAVGQKTIVDTRSSKVEGVVSRIDPAITGGTVQVDIDLAGALPPEAKPDMSVDGVIETAMAKDALYVSRPVFAQSFSKTTVYRLVDNGGAAERVPVELGRASTSQVEVLSGLKPGDRIIFSDPTAWEKYNRIVIN